MAPMYPSRTTALRVVAPLVVVLVLLATALVALRVEQVLVDSAQSRGLRAVQHVAARIEAGFRIGLALRDEEQLPEWLRRQREEDPSLVAARVLDDRGSLVLQLGDSDDFDGLNAVWTQQLLARGSYAHAAAAAVVRTSGAVG